MPGAIGQVHTKIHPSAAAHITVPGESAQWAVGIFLEAIPALGRLVITTAAQK